LIIKKNELTNHPRNGNFLLSISKKISYVHIAVLFVIYVVFSLVAGGPGILHKEMDIRLPEHISGKPILQILFDAKGMNLGGWEARQLSYLFDIVDGNFVALCIRLGYPHFRSLTHYLFTLIIMLYMWSFMTRILRMDRLLSMLLIALLLTTPSFIYSYYYRTSKIGITLLVILLLGEMYKVIRGDIYTITRNPKPLWLTLIFLFATLALMLFDILGGFFATAIMAYLFLALLFKPDKNRSAAFTGMVIGYAIWVLFFLYLGPAIMFAVTGQKADTSYLTGAPFAYLLNFLVADILPLIIDMIRYLFGYISSLLGTILLITVLEVALWLSIKPNRKSPYFVEQIVVKKNSQKLKDKLLSRFRVFILRYEPLPSLFFLLGSLAIIYDFLVTRHPPLLWPDVRPTYYIMPAQASLLFGLAILLTRAKIRWALKSPLNYYFTIFLFTVFLVCNVIGSINIKDVLFSGPNTTMNLHDPALLTALAHLDSPGYKPDGEIALDPIYLLFLSSK
jgi:hypothetical protein